MDQSESTRRDGDAACGCERSDAEFVPIERHADSLDVGADMSTYLSVAELVKDALEVVNHW